MAKDDANPCAGPMGWITIFVGMFVILLMFDQNFGNAVAIGMGWILSPITFGGNYPIWTIFLSGVILVVISTLIRHKFTDWYEVARTQKVQSEFNKELRDATLKGDELRRKKLQEKQLDIMKLTNTLMMSNMKVMIFTMLFAILIWRWLFFYLGGLDISTLSLPGFPSWPMTRSLCWNLPYWTLIYLIVSVPLGQVLSSAFKTVEFGREASKTESARESELRQRLNKLDQTLSGLGFAGTGSGQIRTLRAKAESALAERDFIQSERHLKDAEALLEDAQSSRVRTQELIATTKTMIDSSRERGINVSSAESMFAGAESAFARGDFTSAIYQARQCQQKVKSLKERYAEADGALKDFQEQLGMAPGQVKDAMAERMRKVETAMDGSDYDTVLDEVKRLKSDADTAQKQFESAGKQLERARALRDELHKLSIDAIKYEELLLKAEDKFNLAQYGESAELAREAVEELDRLKKLYSEASESVQFAKLVVANARNFGANIPNAESIVAEAELALERHDYDNALSKANSAKAIAEEAKRNIQRQTKRDRSR